MLTITHRQGGRSVNVGYSALNTQRYLYALGEIKPNYPMPVLIDEAFTATNYLFLSLCPENNGPEHMPCLVCLDDFLDGLEGMDRRQAECLTE